MNIDKLEKVIGITFDSKELLQTSMVHRSYQNEHHDFSLPSNEKLEFLGDSVLSLTTSLYLYKKYPEYKEGDYTDIKAAIVNTQQLYEAAKSMNLGAFLLLSNGEEDNKGRENASILADAFEALLGAIYLEKGFETAADFVEKFLLHETLDRIVKNKLYLPAKNVLQEFYQDQYKRLPVYKVLSASGPEHNKMYKVGVFKGTELQAEGVGKSKKQAEEDAARNTLQKLGM